MHCSKVHGVCHLLLQLGHTHGDVLNRENQPDLALDFGGLDESSEIYGKYSLDMGNTHWI